MSDVKTKFTSDAQQAIKEIEKLQKSMVKLREENAALASGTRQAARENRTFYSEQIRGATHMVTGLFTVHKAVHLVTDAYREWRQEVKLLGEESKKQAADLTHTLAKTGDLLAGKQVEAFIARSEVDADVMRASIEGVSDAAPTLPLKRRLDLSLQAGRSAVAHGDPTGVGGLLGQVVKIDPRLSADDALDVATMLRQSAGGRAAELSGRKSIQSAEMLVGSGAASPEDALGLLTAVLRNEGDVKTVDKIAARIAEPGERVKARRGHRLTPDEIAQNAFIDMTPNERFEAVLRDDATRKLVLGDADAARFERIKRPGVTAAARGVREAMRTDLGARQIEGLMDFEAGRQHAANVDAETRNKAAGDPLGNRAQSAARAKIELDTLLKEQVNSGQIGPLGVATAKADFQLGALINQIDEAIFGRPRHMDPDSRVTGFYTQMVDLARKQLETQEKALDAQRNQRRLPDPDAHRERN